MKVSGHVFVDANRNGQPDGGERRLPDVMVSDGERVARTGQDGAFSFSFQIPAETHHRFVFVTRPTGYASTNSFFLRIPFDAPETEYVAAFGFVEDPKARRDSFSFVTTSDTQFSEVEWMIPTAKDYAQMTGGPAAARVYGHGGRPHRRRIAPSLGHVRFHPGRVEGPRVRRLRRP